MAILLSNRRRVADKDYYDVDIPTRTIEAFVGFFGPSFFCSQKNTSFPYSTTVLLEHDDVGHSRSHNTSCTISALYH